MYCIQAAYRPGHLSSRCLNWSDVVYVARVSRVSRRAATSTDVFAYLIGAMYPAVRGGGRLSSGVFMYCIDRMSPESRACGVHPIRISPKVSATHLKYIHYVHTSTAGPTSNHY